MSVTRKGPVSMFWAGTLEAKIAALDKELAHTRKQRDAKAAQLVATRSALVASFGKVRRLSERLAELTKATQHAATQHATTNRIEGDAMSTSFPSGLSPQPDENGRYYGFYRSKYIEVAVIGMEGELAFVAYVDGQELPGVYDSRNIAEVQAQIAIDKSALCEVEG